MKLLLIIFSLISLTFSCTAQNSSAYQNLDNVKFAEKMKAQNTVVLDVRRTDEFSSGHLENAQLLDVTQSDFAEKIKSLDKTKTYLVYCRSGGRSAMAASILEKNGFKSVFNLTNGITGWDGKVVK
jgi:rhodanese-related sulfurtransferase